MKKMLNSKFFFELMYPVVPEDDISDGCKDFLYRILKKDLAE